MRSLVGGRRPIGVALTQRDSDAAAMVTSPRFGTEKCVRGDVAGRWVDVAPLGGCRPPYCTSGTPETVFETEDSVQTAGKWVWVPYSCYYHLYSRAELVECAQQRDLSWLHVFGDSQVREITAQLLSMSKPGQLARKFSEEDFTLDDALRLTYKFYGRQFNLRNVYPSSGRNFTLDKRLYDYYGMGSPHVRHRALLWCRRVSSYRCCCCCCLRNLCRTPADHTSTSLCVKKK
jgi:hypothetical protein